MAGSTNTPLPAPSAAVWAGPRALVVVTGLDTTVLDGTRLDGTVLDGTRLDGRRLDGTVDEATPPTGCARRADALGFVREARGSCRAVAADPLVRLAVEAPAV